MNIIFYRYNSVCEPDFIDAFEKFGFSVTQITEEIRRKDLTNEDRVELISRAIQDSFDRKDIPFFIFSINFYPVISMVCEKLGMFYVCVSVDCPVAEIYSHTIRNPHNRVFLFDRKQWESVREENPGNIHYLPLGAAVERMDKIPKPKAYDYEVSFIGSLYTEKDRYADLKKAGAIDKTALEHLEHLIDEQRKAAGFGMSIIEENLTDEDIRAVREADPDFYSDPEAIIDMDRYLVINNYLGNHLTSLDRIDILNRLAAGLPEGSVHLFTRSDTSAMDPKVVVHGGVESLTEMPDVFRRTMVNLNLTSRTIQDGLPQRVWDILGSDSFCLTTDAPVFREHQHVRDHVGLLWYPEEIVEVCETYLEDHDRRIRMNEEGYEAVKASETVFARVQEILKRILPGIYEEMKSKYVK